MLFIIVQTNDSISASISYVKNGLRGDYEKLGIIKWLAMVIMKLKKFGSEARKCFICK